MCIIENILQNVYDIDLRASNMRHAVVKAFFLMFLLLFFLFFITEAKL